MGEDQGLLLIVNPAAGKGRTRKLLPAIREGLRQRGIVFQLLETEGKGHATELAAGAKGSVVIAVGGDGTVNEVVNGIAGTGKILGILPTGSANDLLKAIRIPADLSAALDVLVRGTTQPLDLPEVVVDGQDDRTVVRRLFLNGVGVGFDAQVAATADGIRYLSGLPLYVAAVLKTLGRYKAPDFRITIDGNRSSGRKLLVAVGNGPCAGGGFFLTPEAKPDDGLLDVCAIDMRSILGILRLMPAVMSGKHLHLDSVLYRKCKSLALESETPFAVHADGEIVASGARRVEVGLRERALKVLVDYG